MYDISFLYRGHCVFYLLFMSLSFLSVELGGGAKHYLDQLDESNIEILVFAIPTFKSWFGFIWFNGGVTLQADTKFSLPSSTGMAGERLVNCNTPASSSKASRPKVTFRTPLRL
uniref:Uncharacterized protein n=1 Tax=Cacopsylla melanoneura TaxID=428564 RepID=A0A8D8V812_9HEMI